MAKNKPNQGTKKTETLTLRLDPKMKFTIELLSRVWHQSITGVIETAVGRTASAVSVKDNFDKEVTIGWLAEITWSPDEVERLIRLSVNAPQLLSHDEACAWAVIDSADEDAFFSYWMNSSGEVKSVRPRAKVIKMAWPLIKSRAEEVSKTGTSKPLTYEEIEAYVGKPLASIKETRRVEKWEKELDDANWITRWDSKDFDDLEEQLGNVSDESFD